MSTCSVMQKLHDPAVMAKRRRLLGLLLAAVIGGALLLWFTRDTQPTYHGKPLSEWVALCSITGPRSPRFDPAKHKEAADAIRHIGTNAIPLLLSLIDGQRSAFHYRNLTTRLPAWILASPVTHWARQHHPVVLMSFDAIGLSEALGPLAAPAIPELVQRVSSTNWTGYRELALQALACTGPEATAAALSDTNPTHRIAIVLSIRHMAPQVGTNACLARLKAAMQDPDPNVRASAAQELNVLAPDLFTESPSAPSQISVH